MRALLDVNVLIALLDSAHLHHRRASDWFDSAFQAGWATCPITQNGCIRIMAQPAYPSALAMPDVAARLAEAAGIAFHAFWPDDVNLLGAGAVQWPQVLGHRQLTDAYLLALAVKHGGRLVTLDRRVSLQAVPGAAPAHLMALC